MEDEEASTGGKPPTERTFDVEELYHPAVERSLRHLPKLLAGAARLVWAAGRRQLVLNALLQVVSSAAMAVQVLLGKRVIAQLLASKVSGNFRAVVPSVIILAGVLAVASIATIIKSEVLRLLAELVARSSMTQVMHAAAGAELRRFESPTFHDRLQRAIVNASIRPLQMTTGLLAVGSSILGSAAVGFVLVTIEPLFLGLGILAAIPVTIASLRVGGVLYRFAIEQTPTDRERTYIQTLLVEKDPAKEIRAYELASFLEARFASLYEKRISALREVIKRRMMQGVLGALLTATIFGAALGLLILFVADGRVSLAGAGAAAVALLLLGAQLQGLAYGLGQLYESSLFIEDFNSFVRSPLETGPVGGGTEPPAHVGHVTVRNLSFTYPSRIEPSLENIHIDIPPGQVVALVGENGSGKTTLAKLLAGLYPPESGNIYWSGTDISSLHIDMVRKRVAVLFQDFVRYSLSAHENISVGRWQRGDDGAAVLEAAVRSGADSFLKRLPRSYDTYLGPQFFGGSDLSGGQWQRVALARALFRNAELVVLDEPTAALDPRAEAALFGAVRELFIGRSIVLISHRFASVRLADYIYVMDAGRIVEEGDHEQLMAQKGLYAELFALQSAAFGFI